MSGLPIGACRPYLKFVSLTLLELLALNAQKFTGAFCRDCLWWHTCQIWSPYL